MRSLLFDEDAKNKKIIKMAKSLGYEIYIVKNGNSDPININEATNKSHTFITCDRDIVDQTIMWDENKSGFGIIHGGIYIHQSLYNNESNWNKLFDTIKMLDEIQSGSLVVIDKENTKLYPILI